MSGANDSRNGSNFPRPSAPLWLMLPVAFASFAALLRLGYGTLTSAALLAAIILGGGLDLPLGSWKTGASSAPGRLGVNLGGCLVPLGMAVERAWSWPRSALAPALASVALVAVLSYLLARPETERGVVLAWPLTALLAAALGLVLAPAKVRPSTLAFVSGLLGPLLGAELPHLRHLYRARPVHAGIGGGGLLDGLVWSSLLAAWMAVPV